MAASPVTVLGLDPGSRRTGFGVVTAEGSRLVHVASGSFSPPSRDPFERRLHRIQSALACEIERFAPDAVAVEDLFHAVNVRSALRLAHVRGVLLAAVAAAGLTVVSYAPREVKKTVAGTGAASKGQVAWMVSRLLGQAAPLADADAADALAVAICHTHHLGPLSRGRHPGRAVLRPSPGSRG